MYQPEIHANTNSQRFYVVERQLTRMKRIKATDFSEVVCPGNPLAPCTQQLVEKNCE